MVDKVFCLLLLIASSATALNIQWQITSYDPMEVAIGTDVVRATRGSPICIRAFTV